MDQKGHSSVGSAGFCQCWVPVGSTGNLVLAWGLSEFSPGRKPDENPYFYSNNVFLSKWELIPLFKPLFLFK